MSETIATVSAIRMYREAVEHHLEQGIIPFWEQRSLDTLHGGFLTNYDAHGRHQDTPEKYLNTQCRTIWWFSALARQFPTRQQFKQLAEAGVNFLLDHFWDVRDRGWYWKVKRDGSPLDRGKVVYGHSFVIYALSEYTLATGDVRGLNYAARTFDLLQKHCADTLHGGYFENLEPDWLSSAPGFHGGDRKSLDTHMHLMEAFTVLLAVSNDPTHRHKLMELVDLVVHHMIDPVTGSGRNQFSIEWKPVPPISVRRTWNAERGGETAAAPTDTTSYGHNVELAWLLHRALKVAKEDVHPYLPVIRRLIEHAVATGVDWECGGVYRDGTADGEVLVSEKEWWQQAEALVGFLDAYETFGDERFWNAFVNVWDFVSEKMINHDVGEWYTLLARGGTPLVAELGSPWKVAYHTGRSMLECMNRLSRLEQRAQLEQVVTSQLFPHAGDLT